MVDVWIVVGLPADIAPEEEEGGDEEDDGLKVGLAIELRGNNHHDSTRKKVPDLDQSLWGGQETLVERVELKISNGHTVGDEDKGDR